MKTKRLRLKRWAITSIYLSLLLIVFVSMMFISNKLESKYGDTLNLSYILKTFIDESTPVINITNTEIKKPFDKENITVDINYYDYQTDAESQKNSLILYESTYMPNTGILYTSPEVFDCIATLDGKVTKVSTDELLGNVIEITHSSELVTTYYSVDNVCVKEGTEVKQGDVIASSGKNKISTTSDNMLLFEVSLKGNNINPDNYYKMSLKDLNA